MGAITKGKKFECKQRRLPCIVMFDNIFVHATGRPSSLAKFVLIPHDVGTMEVVFLKSVMRYGNQTTKNLRSRIT